MGTHNICTDNERVASYKYNSFHLGSHFQFVWIVGFSEFIRLYKFDFLQFHLC